MTFRSILFIDEIEKHPKNQAQKHERNTNFNFISLNCTSNQSKVENSKSLKNL